MDSFSIVCSATLCPEAKIKATMENMALVQIIHDHWISIIYGIIAIDIITTSISITSRYRSSDSC